jgi:molybdenum cofactor guanylyltransferase
VEESVSGIILAGGRSRRMGRDKRATTLGGRPLLQIAFDLVAAVSDEVLLSCRGDDPPAADLLAGRSVSLAFDVRGAGPLAGLEAALMAARHELAIVVPVDMPALDVSLLSALLDAARAQPKTHGAVFVLESTLVPFPGAYRRSILPIVSAQLDAGALRVSDTLKRLDLIGLPSPVDTEARRLFMNVNTPAELESFSDDA